MKTLIVFLVLAAVTLAPLTGPFTATVPDTGLQSSPRERDSAPLGPSSGGDSRCTGVEVEVRHRRLLHRRRPVVSCSPHRRRFRDSCTSSVQRRGVLPRLTEPAVSGFLGAANLRPRKPNHATWEKSE